MAFSKFPRESTSTGLCKVQSSIIIGEFSLFYLIVLILYNPPSSIAFIPIFVTKYAQAEVGQFPCCFCTFNHDSAGPQFIRNPPVWIRKESLSWNARNYRQVILPIVRLGLIGPQSWVYRWKDLSVK